MTMYVLNNISILTNRNLISDVLLKDQLIKVLIATQMHLSRIVILSDLNLKYG